MRIAVPLFAKIKTVFDDTPAMVSSFPGSWVYGTRLKKPADYPAVIVMITGEDRVSQTNRSGYFEFDFELGIMAQTFETAGDEILTELLESTTIGITANGPIDLNAKLKLLAISKYPEGARYEEDDVINLHACFSMFKARVAT